MKTYIKILFWSLVCVIIFQIVVRDQKVAQQRHKIENILGTEVEVVKTLRAFDYVEKLSFSSPFGYKLVKKQITKVVLFQDKKTGKTYFISPWTDKIIDTHKLKKEKQELAKKCEQENVYTFRAHTIMGDTIEYTYFQVW